MLAPKDRKGYLPEPLFVRLDRAAAELNPTLAFIAIGLLILNILVVFSFVIPPAPARPFANAPACTADAAPGGPR